MPNGESHTIIGHLGKDADMRDVPNIGHVCTFSVAVNYGKKDSRKTTWYNVECWHGTAKGCAHLRKGDAVICHGAMREDRWQTGETWHSKWKLVADVVGKCLYVKDEPTATHEEDYHETEDEVPF